MRFITFVRQMFTSHSGISSKRVCGVIGWFVAVVVLIYCTIMCIQAPLMIDTFLICVMALLGIDSVTGIWKNLVTMKEILKKIVNFLKQSDKLKHCLVNLLVMLIAGSINIWLGIGLAVGLSLGKEYGDSKAPGNKWDWYDILADAIGIVTGLLLVLI